MNSLTVVTEKGSLLAVAMLLVSAGATKSVEGDLPTGVILIVIGLGLLFAREHLKLHRWAHAWTYWRGKDARE